MRFVLVSLLAACGGEPEGYADLKAKVAALEAEVGVLKDAVAAQGEGDRIAIATRETQIQEFSGAWTLTQGSRSIPPEPCPAPETAESVRTWLVSRGDDGAMVVSVQGETAYPRLVGEMSGDRIRLGQEVPGGSAILYDLRLEEGGWSGTGTVSTRGSGPACIYLYDAKLVPAGG